MGCRTLVGLPRVELPVLCADEEVADETEDTPKRVNSESRQAYHCNSFNADNGRLYACNFP